MEIALHPDISKLSFGDWLVRNFVIYVVIPVMIPCKVITSIFITKKMSYADIVQAYRIVNKAHNDPGLLKDTIYINRLWDLPSARPYIEQNALEYQRREGYCGQATLRCVLKSFEKFPKSLVPGEKLGASNPTKFASEMNDLLRQRCDHGNSSCSIDCPYVCARVVREKSYEKFIEQLRMGLRDSQNTRIVINFLRPALIGFMKPRIIPAHIIYGMVGGHFSPVVGILEEDNEGNKLEDPLVGLFDVNHKYGTYLVPARRLYDAVITKDVFTQQSRALIFVEMMEEQ